MTPHAAGQWLLAGADRCRFHHRSSAIPSALFHATSRALAGTLASIRARRDGRFGILLENDPLFLVSMTAVIASGTSVALLGPNMQPYELAAAVDQAAIDILITDESHEVALSRLPGEQRLLLGHDLQPWGAVKLWAIGGAEARGASAKPPKDEIVCQFTSGVTGESRIASRSYANVVDEIENFVATVALRPDDVILCPAPLFHAYGLFNGFVPSLRTGAVFITEQRFFPAEILELTRRHRPTVLVGVPFMYDLLNQTNLSAPADFSCYRACFCAGAKLSRTVAEGFEARFGVRIHQIYGSTETGIISVNLPSNEPFDVLSVGRPVRKRELAIFDEDGRALPAGSQGEIAVRSGGTMAGYLGGVDLTREKFRDGYYLTGDIGWLDDAGRLHIAGRKSKFIKTAGRKVDPHEVETVVMASGLVTECAVIGVVRPNFDEVIRACVVLRDGATTDQVQAWCAERLSPYKLPRELRAVDALPRSPTGKILGKYLLDGDA